MIDPIVLFLATEVASAHTLILLLVLIALFLVFHTRYRDATVLAGTSVGMLISVPLLKTITNVPRPTGGRIVLEDAAFPSGHATGVMFLFLVAYLLLAKHSRGWIRWSVLFGGLLLVGLVGYSRLYLGVHTPLDVVGGYAFGGLWAFLCHSLARR